MSTVRMRRAEVEWMEGLAGICEFGETVLGKRVVGGAPVAPSEQRKEESKPPDATPASGATGTRRRTPTVHPEATSSALLRKRDWVRVLRDETGDAQTGNNEGGFHDGLFVGDIAALPARSVLSFNYVETGAVSFQL